jgi:hypothetical protein
MNSRGPNRNGRGESPARASVLGRGRARFCCRGPRGTGFSLPVRCYFERDRYS